MRRGNQAAGTRRISFCVALWAKEGTGRLCVCVHTHVFECVAAERMRKNTNVCLCAEKSKCAQRARRTEGECVRVCASDCECVDTVTPGQGGK